MECGGFSYWQTSGRPEKDVNQGRNINPHSEAKGFCADIYNDRGEPFMTTATYRTMAECDEAIEPWIIRMDKGPVVIPASREHVDRVARGII